MKNNLFVFAVATFTLFIISCTGEEANTKEGKENKSTAGVVTFETAEVPATRTSIDHTVGGGAIAYWEMGDKIFVKDDDGTYRQSTSSDITGKTKRAKFQLSGNFGQKQNYSVAYVGTSGQPNYFSIQDVQTQVEPNNTKHFGEAGDCGIATAKGSNGNFFFLLEHRASYLCFLPRTANTILQNCYLTKVEVISDNDIVGQYKISDSGELTRYSSGGTKATVVTKGTGAYSNGFPLTNTTTSPETNAAYMVIEPGTHKLTIKYYIKDYASQVEGTVTKEVPERDYKPNTVYDFTANLMAKDYTQYMHNYYMWDATVGQDYWNGVSDDDIRAAQIIYPAQTPYPNYPKNNSDPRWYSEAYSYTPPTFPRASRSCATAPNMNEMIWYVQYGDPRYDDEIWTFNKHLYKGGLWLKKRNVIATEQGTTTAAMNVASPDGLDRRDTFHPHSSGNWTPFPAPSQTMPSDAEKAKYFYLPALGESAIGYIISIGSRGAYWTSTPSHSGGSQYAIRLEFISSSIDITQYSTNSAAYRYGGCQVWAFE